MNLPVSPAPRDDLAMAMIFGVIGILALVLGSDVVELVISRKSLRPPKVWT